MNSKFGYPKDQIIYDSETSTIFALGQDKLHIIDKGYSKTEVELPDSCTGRYLQLAYASKTSQIFVKNKLDEVFVLDISQPQEGFKSFFKLENDNLSGDFINEIIVLKEKYLLILTVSGRIIIKEKAGNTILDANLNEFDKQEHPSKYFEARVGFEDKYLVVATMHNNENESASRLAVYELGSDLKTVKLVEQVNMS